MLDLAQEPGSEGRRSGHPVLPLDHLPEPLWMPGDGDLAFAEQMKLRALDAAGGSERRQLPKQALMQRFGHRCPARVASVFLVNQLYSGRGGSEVHKALPFVFEGHASEQMP